MRPGRTRTGRGTPLTTRRPRRRAPGWPGGGLATSRGGRRGVVGGAPQLLGQELRGPSEEGWRADWFIHVERAPVRVAGPGGDVVQLEIGEGRDVHHAVLRLEARPRQRAGRQVDAERGRVAGPQVSRGLNGFGSENIQPCCVSGRVGRWQVAQPICAKRCSPVATALSILRSLGMMRPGPPAWPGRSTRRSHRRASAHHGSRRRRDRRSRSAPSSGSRGGG